MPSWVSQRLFTEQNKQPKTAELQAVGTLILTCHLVPFTLDIVDKYQIHFFLWCNAKLLSWSLRCAIGTDLGQSRAHIGMRPLH